MPQKPNIIGKEEDNELKEKLRHKLNLLCMALGHSPSDEARPLIEKILNED